MSVSYFGDFPEDSTVYIPFNTFSSNDPQASVTITNLLDADLHVHKDGSITQIVTDGATISIDFDTITGNHIATIDTSASADYSIGSDYMVRMEGTTVDGGTINAWIGMFSIENRFNEVDVTKFGGTAGTFSAGRPEVNTTHVSGTAQTANDNGADINTLLTRIVGTLAAGTHNPASAAQIAVLSDWINGGRLDLILDIIAADTTTDIPALIATAQADLDTITGTDGAALASTQQSITFQPITVTAADGIDNITLAGSGSADGLAFTRSGSGGLFDTAWAAAVESEVADALTAYDPATGAEVAAVDTKIDTIDTVVDALLALLDDARTEPGQGAPPVNPDTVTKIDYLYKAWRNKIEQTATEWRLYDDAGTTVDQKATVSDDGTTATSGEVGTGP